MMLYWFQLFIFYIIVHTGSTSLQDLYHTQVGLLDDLSQIRGGGVIIAKKWVLSSEFAARFATRIKFGWNKELGSSYDKISDKIINETLALIEINSSSFENYVETALNIPNIRRPPVSNNGWLISLHNFRGITEGIEGYDVLAVQIKVQTFINVIHKFKKFDACTVFIVDNTVYELLPEREAEYINIFDYRGWINSVIST